MSNDVWSIILPKSFNDGTEVPQEVIRGIEDEMVKRFGGFTRAGEVSGEWKNDSGDIVPDVSALYVLGGAEQKDVKYIADYAAHELDQDAVIYWKSGTDVGFQEKSKVPLYKDRRNKTAELAGGNSRTFPDREYPKWVSGVS